MDAAAEESLNAAEQRPSQRSCSMCIIDVRSLVLSVSSSTREAHFTCIILSLLFCVIKP